ncbi:hypothetical protein [Bacillus pinisoli]|uniref:hypothetical protein n=1 Tax=Bacillus pinisoli TaxID=2901866 RepID=UPI001FF2F581|nr:hypothetical protein [Bacillus pinisoli]
MNVDKLYSTAKNVFELMAEIVGTNTFYIALNDGKTNRIIQAFNREKELVKEGALLNLQDTY